MHWTLEYWHNTSDKSTMESWLDHLNHDQFKAVIKEVKLLEEEGNTLKLPHSRALGHGLFEIRERRYGFRIYYGFDSDHTIILFKAGNKATQENDIQTARAYLLKLRANEA